MHPPLLLSVAQVYTFIKFGSSCYITLTILQTRISEPRNDSNFTQNLPLPLTSPFLIGASPLLGARSWSLTLTQSLSLVFPVTLLTCLLIYSIPPFQRHLHFHLNCLKSFLAMTGAPFPAPVLPLPLPTGQRDCCSSWSVTRSAHGAHHLPALPLEHSLRKGPSPPSHLSPPLRALPRLQFNRGTHFIPHFCPRSSLCRKCPSCFLSHSTHTCNSFGEYLLSTCHVSERAVSEMNRFCLSGRW